MQTDVIELHSGNARQAAYFYKNAFGFQSLGVNENCSYVLRQNQIILVLKTVENTCDKVHRIERKNDEEIIRSGSNSAPAGLLCVDHFSLDRPEQYIAFTTKNIIETVNDLKKRGVEFMDVPASYYDDLPKRIPGTNENIYQFRKLNILAERDEKGYLLQIFTKPVQDKPALFFGIIQRKLC